MTPNNGDRPISSRVSAAGVFRIAFKRGNFVTPEVDKYGWLHDGDHFALAYELSYGKGIFNPIIWGVTVLRINSKMVVTETKLSRGAFKTRAGAMKFVRRLRAHVAKHGPRASKSFAKTYEI